MEVSPITAVLGAIVEGVDLRDLSDAAVRDIEQTLAKHLVVYFPNQDLDRFQLRDLAGRFGPNFLHPIERTRFEDCPEVLQVRREPQGGSNVFGGGGWHADFTWNTQSGYLSMLHGKIVPEVGGDTCFTSSIAVFASLSDTLKSLLRGLNAVHCYYDYDGQSDRSFVAIHPVVRTHPISGQEGLFVNGMFVTHFDGMTDADSTPLLRYLYGLLEQHQFACRFRWQEGGLMMWDNRFTLHFPINDNRDEVRLMIWTACLER